MTTFLDYQFLQKLSQLPFVEEIWLYGSRARGDNQERSDIDLALVCPTATTNDWFLVREIINTADTLLKIDCVRFDTLDQKGAFAQNILRDKKVLFKKDHQ